MTINFKHTALALSLIGAFSGAQATALITNVVTANVDVSATYFGGTLLATATTPISNSSYNGTARAAVYDTGTGLDFYYQFTNDGTSQNGVTRFTGFDFSSLGSSAVSVYQTATAFGIFSAGTQTSDNADRSSFGVIGFNFLADATPQITPGSTSYIQVIRTDARLYVPGNFGLLNGIGDNAAAFAPTAVPEPETNAMVLAGLALIGTIVRRRAANKGADSQA